MDFKAIAKGILYGAAGAAVLVKLGWLSAGDSCPAFLQPSSSSSTTTTSS